MKSPYKTIIDDTCLPDFGIVKPNFLEVVNFHKKKEHWLYWDDEKPTKDKELVRNIGTWIIKYKYK